jgi:hypothetical protein
VSAKLDTWKRKRDLRIHKKAKAKAERIHEWVLLRILLHVQYFHKKTTGGTP